MGEQTLNCILQDDINMKVFGVTQRLSHLLLHLVSTLLIFPLPDETKSSSKQSFSVESQCYPKMLPKRFQLMYNNNKYITDCYVYNKCLTGHRGDEIREPAHVKRLFTSEPAIVLRSQVLVHGLFHGAHHVRPLLLAVVFCASQEWSHIRLRGVIYYIAVCPKMDRTDPKV